VAVERVGTGHVQYAGAIVVDQLEQRRGQVAHVGGAPQLVGEEDGLRAASGGVDHGLLLAAPAPPAVEQ
jgi:hypothetical protein